MLPTDTSWGGFLLLRKHHFKFYWVYQTSLYPVLTGAVGHNNMNAEKTKNQPFPLLPCLAGVLLLVFMPVIPTHGQSLKFIKNQGQWADHILYVSDFPTGGRLFLEKDGWVVVLKEKPIRQSHRFSLFRGDKEKVPEWKRADSLQNCFAYKVKWMGSTFHGTKTDAANTDYMNFYIGEDSAHWRSRVPNFNSVTYSEIYPHIDIALYSKGADMKYDFIVRPQGKVEDIVLAYQGIKSLSIDRGNLCIEGAFAEICDIRPFAYQLIHNDTVAVSCCFELHDTVVSFQVGDYNKAYPLFIDPQLVFSSYSGSSADNWGFSATYDSEGNAYAGGIVNRTGYPTSSGAYQENWNGAWDMAIIKFSSDGTRRLYATYLGGSGNEMPHSMIVNDFGELLVFGTTGSQDYPTTPNAHSRRFKGGTSVVYDNSIAFLNGTDMFITKFNPTGTQLQASTYLGGSDNDGLNYRHYYNDNQSILYFGNDSLYANYGDGARGELITDDQNNVYIGSCTFSSDFPTTTNAFQPVCNGKQEGVVCKLDKDLQHLIFSSYLGGSEDDAIFSIDTDSQYELFVTGGTVSRDFPVSNQAFQPTHSGGSTDAFVACISYSGNSLLSSSYFGSSAFDLGFFVRTDPEDHVYIYGQTKAPGNTLVHNATYNIPNSGQFIAKLSHDLSSREWSTVFGTGDGRINLSPTALAIDACRRIYIAGWGRVFKYFRQNNPLGTIGMETTPDAYQSITDGQDFYFMSLAPDASALNYATFFGEMNASANYGTDHVDGGTCRFDKKGTCYQAACAGCGGSNGFPVYPHNVWSNSNNATNCNNAIVKFNIHNDFALADFERPPVSCLSDTVSFHNTGVGTTFLWDFGDGSQDTARHPQHIYTAPGIYEVRLIASVDNGCKLHDTVSKQVVVLGRNHHTLPDLYTCPNVPIQIGIASLHAPDLSIRWEPTTGLSPVNTSDPFATIDQEQTYNMIISSGNCSDTITQRIKFHLLDHVLPFDSITTCHSPITIQPIDTLLGINFHWSSNRHFSDSLQQNSSGELETPISESGYIYLKTFWNGCTATDSVYITFTGMALSVTTTDVRCHNTQDGTAVASASGGVGAISYTWSNGTTDTDRCEALSAQTQDYWVKVTDTRGCSSTLSFSIHSPDTLTLTPENLTHNLCENNCTGSVSLHATGGTAPYMLKYHSDRPAMAGNIFSLTELCPDTYFCKLTDANNCQIADTIEIEDLNTFTTTITVRDNPCIGVCAGKATAHIEGGTEPYHYIWSNGSDQASISNLCDGEYTVAMSDANGCSKTETISITGINAFEHVTTHAVPATIFGGESTLLSVTEVEGMHCRWSPPQHVANPSAFITTATPESSTLFTVELYDDHGCSHTDTVSVHVEQVICGEPNIFVPNVFTPNGDGINDVLLVKGEWITNLSLMIFDRWGEKVFESDSLTFGWDGCYKGVPCTPGVYYYSLEVSCQGGKKYIKGGDITLLK